MSISTFPAITCPAWCEVGREEHEAGLREWEGHVLHSGRTYSTEDMYVEVFAYAWPDGTLDIMEESPHVHVLAHPDDGMSAEDAETLAQALTKRRSGCESSLHSMSSATTARR